MKIRILNCLVFFIVPGLCHTQINHQRNMIFKENSPNWVACSGPYGGAVIDVEVAPSNPSIMYAASGSFGIYRSANSGDLWELKKFPQSGNSTNIVVDPQDADLVYADHSQRDI